MSLVMPINFGLLISEIPQACHFNLVVKYSLTLKLQSLKVEVALFLLLLYSQKEENCRGSTFKFCNFKASDVFDPDSEWQALNIYKME